MPNKRLPKIEMFVMNMAINSKPLFRDEIALANVPFLQEKEKIRD